MCTLIYILFMFICRLRSDRIAVKVQCFSVDQMHIERNRIGNFHMDLRQAHFVPSGKSCAVII
jgi:hypothetical protein